MTETLKLTSNRPYIIKALCNWLYDNEAQVYIRVDTQYQDLDVPVEHIDEQGFITLNISEDSVGYLDMKSMETLDFSIRFSGIETNLNIDYNAICAVYNPTTGVGSAFERVSKPKAEEPEEANDSKKETKKPFLKIVS